MSVRHWTDAERIREVQARVVRDFYSGTNTTNLRWWSCQVCSWIWRDGQPANHELGCPIEGIDKPVSA